MRSLQTRWAKVNCELKDKAQITAFKALVSDSEQLTQTRPQLADAWIWSGIIKPSFAGAKDGLGALSLAKGVRTDLEQALALKSDALNGSAYTSLGTFYFRTRLAISVWQ